MKQELDSELCKKYPKLFSERNMPASQTCMYWGFECGDGWYNIISALCGNIQSHIDWSRKNRLSALRYNKALKKALEGDSTLLFKHYNYSKSMANSYVEKDIADPHFRPVEAACPQVTVLQVKEKFGSLRFYYRGGDEYVRGLATMAESMSAFTCEVCGSPGKQGGRNWISTLCETHRAERDAKK